MDRTVWDLKPADLVISNRYGRCLFMGFFEEGLESQVISISGVHMVPTSNLLLPEEVGVPLPCRGDVILRLSNRDLDGSLSK